MPRFFVTGQPEDGLLTLRGEDAHHAGRVLRLRPGEAVTLCDGAGTDYDCTVASVEKETVTCRVQGSHPAVTEPRQQLTLCMALPKGDKMDFIVQKAVELGVHEIIPYVSQNCVSRPDKTEKKVERWRKIALEAAAVAACRKFARLSWLNRRWRGRLRARLRCFSTRMNGKRACMMCCSTA